MFLGEALHNKKKKYKGQKRITNKKTETACQLTSQVGSILSCHSETLSSTVLPSRSDIPRKNWEILKGANTSWST